MLNRSRRMAAIACGWLYLASVAPALAQAPVTSDPVTEKPQGEPKVVATVGDEKIHDRDVERALYEALRGRSTPPETIPHLQAEMLGRLIDRRLIIRYLEENKLSASQEDLDLQIANLKKQLAKQNITWPDFLKRAKSDEATMREQFSWQLGWNAYLAKKVNDEVLYDYFNQRKRQYDGTELRVSHILLRPGAKGDQALKDTIAQATRIRELVASEPPKMLFADAAARYSIGPSRRQGGDLGYIPRHGVMAEPFAAAAFALNKGDISQPVVTSFGVHLIMVTDEKKGTKAWADVKAQLAEPLKQDIFEKVAKEQRAKHKIQYTGVMPHYKHGTKELVMGKE